MRRLAALAVVLAMTACAQVQRLLPGAGRADEQRARTVTIVRDEYGVPTIYAPTDAGVAFGLAYAQAEDDFWQLEEDYIHALGRAASYYGDAYLAADLTHAVFEVERLSLQEYQREPAQRRAIWDAFAAGLNYYMRSNRVQPRAITRFDAWMIFARFRALAAGSTIDGVRLGAVVDASPFTVVGSTDTAAWPDNTPAREPPSSSAWAIAPMRSATGHALLVQHDNAPFLGSGQRYELHLHSDEGWHVRGFGVLGTPVPRSGHNEHIAWSHTHSSADHADVYEVTFDHPTDSLLYRYDDTWRRAETWADTILVNTPGGVQARVYTFRKTHHGPIVARQAGKALAIRVARMADGGSLQQWYAMGRASSIEQFRAALEQTSLIATNTLYGDRGGNIYYLHGNAVPVRDSTFDWTRPVDGSSARSEWRGYHTLSDLPQLLNPPSGWLQNASSTPYSATSPAHNVARARYPAYMAPESDTPGARAARRVLLRDSSWTFAALAAAAFDTHVVDAHDAIGLLVRDWEEIGATNSPRAFRLDQTLDRLRAWDRTSTIESSEMKLYALWQERLRSGEYQGAHRYFRAFEDMLVRLERDWGSTTVPWGEINRLQRPRPHDAQPFHDDRHSLPIAGAPASLGVVFDFVTAPPLPGAKRRYGTAGHAAVSVIELGPVIRSASLVAFGQSAAPDSPHFFDQAPLYARGELKPAWFSPADVMAHARRTYRPGVPIATPR